MMDDFISSIEVYDDDNSDLEVIRDIIRKNHQEDSFFIVNIETIVQQSKKWTTLIPKVSPYYVKCNSSPIVVKLLAALNVKFDCASKQEIQQVMHIGVSNRNIIFTNPTKLPSHIEYAKQVKVETMVVDNFDEVMKIKGIYPDAKLVIRIALDGESAGIKFSRKYGTEPSKETIKLINFIKTQQMYLRGFSFHAGSPCWDPKAFGSGIEICKKLIKSARSMGLNETNLIDIGGGFPAVEDDIFHQIAKSINAALNDLDSSIEVISEPGRYFVETSFTLSVFIHSKKEVIYKGSAEKHYYVNDGVYGSFIEELLNISKRVPFPLNSKLDEPKYPSVVWGPTCDVYDCIIKDFMLQDLVIGDWLVWKNMGAYTTDLASPFNGFPPSILIPIIRKSELMNLLNGIDICKRENKLKSDSSDNIHCQN